MTRADVSKSSTHSQWDLALARCERAQVAYFAACDAYCRAEELYTDARPGSPVRPLFLVTNAAEKFDERSRAEQQSWELAEKANRWIYGLDVAEQEQSRTHDAAYAALETLLSTPAPNPAAVARKIELAGKFDWEIADLGPALAELRRMGA